MISAFRRYIDTWPVRIFFMLMVASFVMWGVGDMLRVIGTDTWAVKVAGVTIEGQTFDAEFRRALAAAGRDLPSGQELSPSIRHEVGEQTLQSMITQAAMNQQLRDMRIVVPEPVLADTVRQLPAFRGDNGAFDRAKFEMALRANGLTEAGFLQEVRGQMAQHELLDAVTAGAHIPDSEANPIYASQYEQRSADMAAFPIAAQAEPGNPDEAIAKQWYDNHPDLYATPEYRRVKLIVVSPETLSSEVTVSDKDLETAYQDRQSEYTTIARRSAYVISTTDEAKATALAEQWRAGADWPAMQAAAQAAGAAAIAEDDATQTQFPDPDLAKAVFSTPLNTVSAPVKGALGWFVVDVTKATEGGVTPFEQVKDKLRQRLVTEKALDLVYDRANKLDGQLGNGTTLDNLPPDQGIASTTVTFDDHGLTQDGTSAAIPGETEFRSPIVAAAFAAQKDDAPHLTEVQTPSTGGSGYFALTVEGTTPAGEKPFDAVRQQVEQDWRADQRHHAAELAAQAMLKAVKDGKSFSDAARDAGVTPHLSPLVTRTKRDPDMPPEVQRALFGLKKNQPTMVETAEGFLLAVPVEIVAPDPAADKTAFDQLRTAVGRTLSDDLSATFTEALRLRANPSINHTVVDQIVQP
jgi:peptidyl-prolyl cis-trans isomerase D